MKNTLKGFTLNINAICGNNKDEHTTKSSRGNNETDNVTKVISNEKDINFNLDLNVGQLEIEYGPRELPDVIKALTQIGINYDNFKDVLK